MSRTVETHHAPHILDGGLSRDGKHLAHVQPMVKCLKHLRIFARERPNPSLACRVEQTGQVRDLAQLIKVDLENKTLLVVPTNVYGLQLVLAVRTCRLESANMLERQHGHKYIVLLTS